MHTLLRSIIILNLAIFCFYANSAEELPSVEELSATITAKKQQKEDLTSDLDRSKKALKKEQKVRSTIRLNLRKLELSAKRLKFSPEKDTDAVKNELASVQSEIKSHKAKLKELNEELEQAKVKQLADSLKISQLEEDITKLEEQKEEASRLQVIQAQTQPQTVVEPEVTSQQATESTPLTGENAESIEQERIRAAKREVLANQTTIIEPDSAGDSMPVVEAKSAEKSPAQEQFDLELAQARLIDEARTLRPAAAALNHAKARALVPLNEPPVLGEQVQLYTSLPPGSKPKGLGMMRHLGNNQYMLEIPVNKGKQEFVVGEYRFFKMIPKQFHKAPCMILVDLRNRQNPGFQLLLID